MPIYPNAIAQQSQSMQRQTLPYPQYPLQAMNRPSEQRQPQFRMQKEETPALTAKPDLRMPPPSAFGLGRTADALPSIDWSDLKPRMARLNISSYRLDRISTGFRFACTVSSPEGDRKLQAEAATEAEAIQQVLARAELIR